MYFDDNEKSFKLYILTIMKIKIFKFIYNKISYLEYIYIYKKFTQNFYIYNLIIKFYEFIRYLLDKILLIVDLIVSDIWSSTILCRQRNLIVNEIRCHVNIYVIVIDLSLLLWSFIYIYIYQVYFPQQYYFHYQLNQIFRHKFYKLFQFIFSLIKLFYIFIINFIFVLFKFFDNENYAINIIDNFF